MPKTKKFANRKKDYVYSVGRRREAHARIRLYRGKGETTVNGQSIQEYFQDPMVRDAWLKPFHTVNAANEYWATIKVRGGGKKGQADAVILGLARALSKANKEYRDSLKKAGLLTRDSRIRERRKIGMGGKSRREKQSPKR